MARRGSKANTLFLVYGKGCDSYVWVVGEELIEDWLKSVDEVIRAAVEILAEHGPGLGRPLVDTVVGSRHNNMKELRPGSSGRSEVRILFAFDPKGRAILLMAGDKHDSGSAGTRRTFRSPTTDTTSTWPRSSCGPSNQATQ